MEKKEIYLNKKILSTIIRFTKPCLYMLIL